MAARIGKIGEFNAEEETWNSYIDRFENYCKCNQITDNLQAFTLLTLMGVKTYTLLAGLCVPNKPSSKTYAQIVTLLYNYHNPKSIILERFKFHEAVQKKHENIADFAARLLSLSARCSFGKYLKDALRDRFVCGMHNAAVQKRLLEKHNPTLSELVATAKFYESAMRSAREQLLAQMQLNTSSSSSTSRSLQHTSQQPTFKTPAVPERRVNSKRYGHSSCGKTGHKRSRGPSNKLIVGFRSGPKQPPLAQTSGSETVKPSSTNVKHTSCGESSNETRPTVVVCPKGKCWRLVGGVKITQDAETVSIEDGKKILETLFDGRVEVQCGNKVITLVKVKTVTAKGTVNPSGSSTQESSQPKQTEENRDKKADKREPSPKSSGCKPEEPCSVKPERSQSSLSCDKEFREVFDKFASHPWHIPTEAERKKRQRDVLKGWSCAACKKWWGPPPARC